MNKKLNIKLCLRHGAGFIISFLWVSVVYANPILDNIKSGNISVSNTQNITTIQQGSQKGIINWRSFNIAPNETTRFIQPNKNAITLNRINPNQGVSKIFGHLTSNGKIILVNNSGIYFGPGSQVDVGGLIATTSGISDRNFLQGHYIFDQASEYGGSITNAGQISARYGLVALLGTNVTNTGVIKAELGAIALGSGNTFTLDFNGDQLINFSVDSPTSTGGGVANTGKLLADQGSILVTARQAQDVLDNAINMDGVAIANSVSNKKGEIILDGGDGSVTVSGSIIAKGNATGTSGGNIEVLGSKIHLSSTAIIDASGQVGGGQILIGGNQHGQGPQANALTTVVDRGASLSADAIINGNGGKIIVWSDDNTIFSGTATAKGGRENGNGGFLETSGAFLDVANASVNLLAPYGKTGEWLLDPTNLTITNNSGSNSNILIPSSNTYEGDPNQNTSTLDISNLISYLNSASVTIETTTGGSGTGSGNITIDPSTASFWTSWNSANTLTLSASGNIYVNAAINAPSGRGITMSANGIYLNGGAITTSGAQSYQAPVTLGANTTLTGNGISFSSTITGGGYNLTLADSGTSVLNGEVSGVKDFTTNKLTINTDSISTTGNQLYQGTISVPYTGTTTLQASGTITNYANITGGTNNLVFNSAGNNFTPSNGSSLIVATNSLNITGPLSTDFYPSCTDSSCGGAVIFNLGSGGAYIGGQTTLGMTLQFQTTGTVTLAGAVNGNATNIANGIFATLTFNDTNGTINIQQDIGDSTPIVGISSSNSSSTINIYASNISVQGNGIAFYGATNLNHDLSLNVSGSGYQIYLANGHLDGNYALTVNNSGGSFNDTVPIGSNTPLTSLNVTASTIQLFRVTTTGAQQYTGTTSSGTAITTLRTNSSGDITFQGPVNSVLASYGFTLSALGNVYFYNTVGQTTPLSYLDTTGTTGNVYAYGSITTSGAQSYPNLYVQQPATLTSSTISISNGLYLNSNTTISNSSASSLSQLYGSGNFTKSGTGNLTINNAQYTGTTTVNGGTLLNGSSSAFSTTNSLTIGASGTYDLNGYSISWTDIAGSGVIQNSSSAATFTLSTSGFDTYSGIFSGNLGLTISGAGSITLAGASTYTGATNVTGGGSIKIGINNALPVSTALNLGTLGTLDLVGYAQQVGSLAGSSSAKITNSGSGNTFTVSGSGTSTYTGTINSLINLLFAGTSSGASLTLGSANTYTGTTSVTGGTLIISDAGALGTAPGTETSSISVSGTGTLKLNGVALTNTAAAIGLAGAGAQNTGALLGVGVSSVTNPITLNASASIGSSLATLTLLGNITDTTGYNLTFATGSVAIGTVGEIPALTTITVASGATLIFNNADSISGLNGAGSVNLSSNTLTLTGSNGSTNNFSGQLSNGNLIINSSGTQILSGSNTFSGGTTVTAGTLQLSGMTLGTIDVHSSGLLDVTQNTTVGTTTVSGSGALEINNATLTSSSSISLTGSGSGSGVLFGVGSGILSANVSLNGNSTFAGLNASDTLTINGTVNGSYALTLSGLGTTKFSGQVGNTSSLTSITALASMASVIINTNNIKTSGAQTYNSAVTLGADTTVTSTANGIISFNSSILGQGHSLAIASGGNSSISGAFSGTGSALVFNGAGSLTLSGNNSYTGGTTINQGTLIATTSVNALGTVGTISIAPLNSSTTAILDISALSSLGNSTGAINLDSSVSGTTAKLNTSATMTLSNPIGLTGSSNIFNIAANTTTLSGAVTGSGGFTKLGTGILSISNSGNTLNGVINVNVGTLKVTNAAGLGNASAINIIATSASGSSLDLTSISTGLSNANTITLDSSDGGIAQLSLAGTYNFINNLNFTQAYSITPSNASIVAINTGGNVAFNNVNQFTGAGVIAINNASSTGTLTITNTNNFINLFSIVNGTVVVSGSNNNVFGTSSTVSLTPASSGSNAILDISGYTGTFGANTFSLNTQGGGTSTFISANNTLSNFFSVNGTSNTFQVNSGTTTLTNKVSGTAGILTKTGSGTLALSNTTNSYSGGTVVNAGTIIAAGLANSGTNSSLGKSGLLSLNGGTLAYSGATTSTNLAITFGSGGGTVDVGSGVTLTLSGTLSGVGGLIKANAGILSLTNASNNYSGATSINAGTLSIVSSGALGNSSATITLGNSSATATLSDQSASADTISNPFSIGGTGSDTISSVGSLAINGTINGSGALTINTTSTTLGNTIGVTTALGSLQLMGGGTDIINSASIKTTGAQTYSDGLTLGASVTFTGNGINFTNAITAASHSITLNDSGVSTFAGAVSGLTTLTTNAINLNNTSGVSSSGAQSYGAVTLGVDQTLTSTAAGGITFSTVDGAHALTIANGSGVVTFSNAVGNTSALTSLSIGTGDTTNINASTIKTTGPQTYNSAVTLGAGVTFVGNGINFVSTITGANHSLTLTDSGTSTFAGAVSGLTTLTTSAINLNSISGVSSSGAQSYGAVILGADQTLTSTTAGGIAFNSTIDGAHVLAIANSSGVVTFSNPVGNTTALSSLSVGTGDATNINTTTIKTNGVQTYNSAVTLGVSATFVGNGINFVNTITGANHSLTLTDSGTSTFASAVSGLTTLATNAINLNSTSGVSASGAQSYGAVTLGADQTLTSTAAGGITFNSTIDGAHALTIANSSGVVTFSNPVGNTTALTSLSVGTGDATNINTATIKTSGAQTYNSAVTLGVGATFVGNGINFVNTITGANHSLVLTDSGTSTFAGVVSGLTTLATNAINLNSASGVSSSGAQSYGAVALGADQTLTSTAAGGITFNSTIDGAHALAIANTSGVVTFGNLVGNSTALTSLSVGTGDTTNMNTSTIITTGAQTYNSAVTLGAGIIFVGNGINFVNTITGANHSLTLTDGGTSAFSGAVSGLTTLATNAINLNSASGVSSSGAQSYGTVILGADQALTSTAAGGITFNSTIDGAHGLTIANGSGIVTFSNRVGNTTALTSLSVGTGDATNINTSTIKTSGVQTYNSAVILGTGATITGNNINFVSTIAGGNNSLSLVDSGASTLDGVISGLSSLSTQVVNLNGGTITTSGNQNYGAATLGANTTIASTANGIISFNSSILGQGYSLAIASGGNSSISGTFSGTGSALVFNGAGSLTLSGNNSYTGGTTINQGTLIATTSVNALGTAGTISIAPLNSSTTAILDISALSSLGNSTGAINLDSSVSGTTAKLNTSATITLSNPIGLTGSSNIFNVLANTTTISGAITGSGGFTKLGTGILSIGNSGNTLNGVINVNVGTLKVTNATGLGNASAINIIATSASGSSLDLTSILTGLSNANTITLDSSDGGIAQLSLAGTYNFSNNLNFTQAYSVTPTNANIVSINTGGNITFNNVNQVTGSGFIAINNASSAGTLTITNTNNFSNLFNIANGTVVVSGNNNNIFGTSASVSLAPASSGANAILDISGYTGTFGSNTFLLNTQGGGTSTFISANNTLNNFFSVNGASNIFQVNTGTTTLTNKVSGTAGILTKTGSGTLALSNTTNSYSGGTVINAGTIIATGLANAGTSSSLGRSGLLSINGGTFAYSGATTSTNLAITLGSGGGTIDVGSGVTLTLSGTLSGVGGLTKTNSGILSLTNASNNYSGATSINAGTLSIVSSAALGNSSSTITLGNSSATATLSDQSSSADTISNPFSIGGTGSDTISSVGSLTINGTINGSGALTINTTSTTLSNTIGATTALGSLQLMGGGTDIINSTLIKTTGAQTYSDGLTLGVNVTFTGNGINFTNAITAASHSLTLTDSGVSTFAGAVSGLTTLITNAINLNSTSGVSSSGAQSYGTVTLGVDQTLTSTAAGGIIFNNTIDGAHALAIANGSGVVTFSNPVGNTTALTSLSVGTDDSTNINTSTIKTSGAQTYNSAVTLGVGATLIGNGINFVNTITGANHSLVLTDSGTSTFSGAVSGLTTLATNAINLNSTSGVSSSGAQSYGAVILGADQTLTSTAAGGIAFNSTIDGAHVLAIANSSGVVTFGNSVGNTTALTSLSIGTGNLTNINASTIKTSGMQTYNSAVTLGTGATIAGNNINFVSTITGGNNSLSLVDSGASTLGGVISGLSSFSTQVVNLNGGTITTSGNQNYGAATLGANTVVTSTASGIISFNSSILGQGYSLTISGGGNASISGAFTGSNSSLIYNGTATLTLAGANSYNGSTTINSGTVQLSGLGTIPSTSALFIASGANFVLNDISDSIGSLSGYGNINLGVLNTTTLTVGNNNIDSSYYGAISGAGGLTKIGTGNLTLKHDSIINPSTNSYTGVTNINLGTLTLDYAGAISTSSSVNLMSTGTLGLNVDETINGLSSNGNININSGITLTLSNNSNATFLGSISGSGTLKMNGTGSQTLSGNSNFSGTIDVTSGTLNINGNVTVGGVTISGTGGVNGILNVTSNVSLGATSISGTGELIINNATVATSSILLSGNGAAGNGAVIGQGSAIVNGDVTLGANSTLATQTMTDTLTFNGSINGPFNLNLSGAGKISFNAMVGNSSAIQSLIDNAGTLTINGGGVHTTGTQTYSGTVNSNAGIDFNATSVILNNATIISTGDQYYNAPIVLQANSVISTGRSIIMNNGASGNFELDLNGTGPVNTFSIIGSLNVNNITVNGNITGDNTLILQGNNAETFNINTSTNGAAGGVASGSGSPVIYNNIENLTGGNNGNTFIFSNGTGISGMINGSNDNATNTIDFSAYTTSITTTITANHEGGFKDTSNSTLGNFENVNNLLGNNNSSLIVAIPGAGKTNTIVITGALQGYVNDPTYFNGYNTFSSSNGAIVQANFQKPYTFVSANSFLVGGALMTFNGISVPVQDSSSIESITISSAVNGDVAQIIYLPLTMSSTSGSNLQVASNNINNSYTVYPGNPSEINLQISAIRAIYVNESLNIINENQTNLISRSNAEGTFSTNCQ